MRKTAVIVGSGPNGLAAAITLARAGLDVEVREAADLPGGGARSGALTLPGFIHDLCSAVHALAVSSPFFKEISLEKYGIKWIFPDAEWAHPLDDGTAVMVHRDIHATAAELGEDGAAYRRMFRPLVEHWDTLMEECLKPIRIPRHPFVLARFGARAFLPATVLAAGSFRNPRARALFAGAAAHSILKLQAPMSSAFALMMGGAAHAVGWPIPRGGAQQVTNALLRVLEGLGGRVITGSPVKALAELRGRDLILCDVTPRQFLRMADLSKHKAFAQLLEQYRYGPGVFKMDWALREPIPWKAKECLKTATVHVAGSLEEIAVSERAAWTGRAPERPFIILTQPTLFDPTRAPSGQHTAWAYCHVPHGWRGSAIEQIENQIERFAPGFRECALARSAWGTHEMEQRNENLVGGDINGGAATMKQFFMRPTWRAYGTPLRGVYLCSSSTPPTGGVHGMCGYNAARVALRGLKAESQ